MNNENDTKPLFIYGMARSGTSYLRRLVNSLPGVFLLYESRVIKTSYDTFQKTDVLANRENFHNFIKQLKSRLDRAPVLFTQPMELYDHLYASFCTHRDFSKFCRHLFSFGVKEGQVWGDKLLHQDEMKLLLKLFPDARFIIIIRDVRSVVYSINRTTKENYYIEALMWADNARFIRRLKESNSNNIIFIRYEDLVDKPIDYLRQIAEFIDQPPPNDFSMACTAHKKSVERWKTNLSPKCVRQIEEVCFNEMKYFGYQPAFAVKAKKMNELKLIVSTIRHLKVRSLTHRRGLKALLNYKALRKYFRSNQEVTRLNWPAN